MYSGSVVRRRGEIGGAVRHGSSYHSLRSKSRLDVVVLSFGFSF